MMKRTLTIITDNKEFNDIVIENIRIASDSRLVDEICIATDDKNADFNSTANGIACSTLLFPEDCNTDPKKRNWINKHFRSQQYDGMLYVAEDNVKFNEESSKFFEKLESMMMVLDYPVWFNTKADRCNYQYSKYVPRLTIHLDRPEFAKFGINALNFTSHANTSLIAYDFKNATDDLLTFNESFEIPMYFIIEYLARRRNNKNAGSLFFMNLYLSIAEELKAFDVIDRKTTLEITQPQMQKEDLMFKQLQVNYAPDNNIDAVLEATYLKLKSKV